MPNCVFYNIFILYVYSWSDLFIKIRIMKIVSQLAKILNSIDINWVEHLFEEHQIKNTGAKNNIKLFFCIKNI